MLGCGNVNACGGGTGKVNMQTSIEVLSERYSKDLNFCANLLVSKVRTVSLFLFEDDWGRVDVVV